MSLRDKLLAIKPAPAPVAPLKLRTFTIHTTTLNGQPLRTLTGGPLELLHSITELRVVQKKQDAPLYGCWVLAQDLPPTANVLKAESFAGMQLAVLDVDVTTAEEYDTAIRILVASGIIFALYTTFSWTPENPKFKVVVPLSRDAPVDLHHRRHDGLAKLVGVASDVSARKPTQRQFVASQAPDLENGRPAPVIGGTRLATPEELMALAPPETQSALARPNTHAVNAEALVQRTGDNRTRDFEIIRPRCELMKAFSGGALLEEPDWRVAGACLKFCQNGEAKFHELSALDPRYARARAQKALDGWSDNIGPPKCGTSTYCPGCKHNGTISSPVQLADIDNEREPTGKRPVDAQKAIEAAIQASGIKPLMDPNGGLYLVKESVTDGRTVKVVTPAGAQAASDSIIASTLALTGKAVGKSALETCFATLRNTARNERKPVDIHLRVAEIGDVLHKDLGPGRILRADPNGWTIVDDAAEGVPLFMRGANAGEIPDPVPFDSPRTALSFLLKRFLSTFSLTPEDALIVIAVMLEWHRTSTPHPIIEIVGPAGCGKSTLCDAIAALVDPSGDGGRVTVGTAGPDIAAAAQHSHVLRLDNAGRFDPATSNLLCSVATGVTLVVRLLYAQSETANLRLHRCLLINGVAAACIAADLQTRVARVELPVRREGFLAESELRGRWQADLPRLQGALCTLLVGVLKELPAVRASGGGGHRLVDSDQVGEAMVRSAGLEAGKYTKTVGQMRERMVRRSASGDPFMMGLIPVLSKLADKPTHTEHVTPHAVLKLSPALAVVSYDENRIRITVRPEALHLQLPISIGGFDRSNAMPATARGLIDAIRRVQPMLSGLAINVDELTARGRSVLQFDFAREAVNET